MIGKDNLIDEKTAASTIQRFAQPSLRLLIFLVIGTMIASALIIGFDPQADLEAVAVVGGGMSAIMLFNVLLLGGQRVVIDGATVTISNVGTLHRKRTFTVQEVTKLHMEYGSSDGVGIALVVTLRASSARKWVSVRINAISFSRTDASLDRPVFLSFVAAVKKAHPAMTVSRLPNGYRGQMARA